LFSSSREETRRDAPPASADETAVGLVMESEQTYDDGRARNLEAILRALAERIRELDEQGRLLANASELTKLLGEARSELFHYEVRATYDTPEVAESRRIVNDAIQQAEQRNTWQSSEGTEDGDDAPEW
jgi:transcriptional regulator with PAS, ATPase and Fis domain